MRLIGMILALAAIGWVLYRASGGGEGDGAIPESYQKSMEKAESVEQTVQDAAQQRLQELEDSER
jgi:hypothetical protein